MPKRKIFDIIPPKKRHPENSSFSPGNFPEKPGVEERFKKRLEKPPIKKKVSYPKIMGLIFLILLIGAAGVYFCIKPKAVIEVWPKTRIVNLKTRVTVKEGVTRPDLKKALLPARLLGVTSTISQEFLSTGKKVIEEKAKGIIRVYNAHSTYNQPLVATTRFVSADGKLFRTPHRVVIYGGHYEKGKFIPGHTDIEVIADQPGLEYNIGPTTFSIPGFAGTAKYTTFYAKSFKPMTGGAISEVPQVTQTDLDKAQQQLTQKALKECKIALFNKITGLENLAKLPQAISTEIVEVFPLAKAGEELDHFVFRIKARAKTLAFKISDLNDFALNYILAQIASTEKVQTQSLKVDFSLEELNLKKNKADLRLEISAKVYSQIDKAALRKIAKAKKPHQLKDILENLSQIKKTRVKLSPFWTRTLPQATKRIQVKLMFD